MKKQSFLKQVFQFTNFQVFNTYLLWENTNIEDTDITFDKIWEHKHVNGDCWSLSKINNYSSVCLKFVYLLFLIINLNQI